MRLFIRFIAIAMLFISSCTNAENILTLDSHTPTEQALNDWVYYTPVTPNTDVFQVSQLSSTRWDKFTPDIIRGLSNKQFWVKFSVHSSGSFVTHRILSITNPHLDLIELYHFNRHRLVNKVVMGDSIPFSRRPIVSNDFSYPFSSKNNDFHTFYLKISTAGSSSIPLTLWTDNAYYQSAEQQSLLYGFQIGVLTAIGIFSLFIAISSHSFSYTYYAGYVLSLTLFVAALHGIAFRFIWPNLPIVQTFILPVLLCLSMAFAFLFSEKVMQLKYHSQPMLRICRVGAAISIFLLFIGLLLDYNLALKMDVCVVMLSSLILMYIALVQGFRGHKLAKLFAIGWACMMLGALISGMMYMGYIELELQANTPFMLGLSFEILFMAALLAIRYNDERLSKLQIQKEALIQAERVKITREDALRIEARSSEQLGKMVQERTLELEIALRELNEANQKLTEQTTIDSLTGVKNRNSFDKRILAEGRISRRQQTPMAILMLDIDHFKSINDTHGHLAGDQALRVIADELKRKLKRPTDLVSRFGGEEFAIILPNTNQEGALQVAETIRKAIFELPISWGKITIPLTVSIGVSVEIVSSEQHTTLLLDQADKALYRAKNEGRNRVMLYSPEQD
ncbi:deoxynucleoside kinase [Shewanella sp. Choline-02u-19]|uniref:sensor domain-containing diguanylate cyclase n=1 Tax=unclassified Shewanella TaxID=196818 RepID=UPI000C33AB36|nr:MULTISPECIES: diguanylate cyclase [unclassified Shewanella]PKG55792.1 deoxynucleoside kinase [Shewanella sp. GutDb-MelDb]PKH58798.1 deoxynucleoside kinase [Shewanella sp. Bg11-22]PKI29055.1 deoxynucleoside kinase [Shewanella sp. Choline-02u-19]